MTSIHCAFIEIRLELTTLFLLIVSCLKIAIKIKVGFLLLWKSLKRLRSFDVLTHKLFQTFKRNYVLFSILLIGFQVIWTIIWLFVELRVVNQ